MSYSNDYGNDFLSSSLRNLISGSMNIPRNVENINKININFINLEKNTIIIAAEIPGVDKKKINVDFYNNLLTISFERDNHYGSSSNSIYEISEIKNGKFERKITLPICVTKKETVSTEYTDGILKITINILCEEENKFSLNPS